MSTDGRALERALSETLAAIEEAVEALAPASRKKSHRATRRASPGVARWLQTPHTLLLFRSSESARAASEQTAQHGFHMGLFQRYLLLDAPWIFVAALLASIGLEAEVLAVHWEQLDPLPGTGGSDPS